MLRPLGAFFTGAIDSYQVYACANRIVPCAEVAGLNKREMVCCYSFCFALARAKERKRKAYLSMAKARAAVSLDKTKTNDEDLRARSEDAATRLKIPKMLDAHSDGEGDRSAQ